MRGFDFKPFQDAIALARPFKIAFALSIYFKPRLLVSGQRHLLQRATARRCRAAALLLRVLLPPQPLKVLLRVASHLRGVPCFHNERNHFRDRRPEPRRLLPILLDLLCLARPEPLQPDQKPRVLFRRPRAHVPLARLPLAAVLALWRRAAGC
eukprot:1250382-Rhodomonas_salina.1